MKVTSKLFDTACGSIGEFTLQNSQAGLTMRNKPSKVQKPTPAQLRFQNDVRNANIAWRNATQAQRQKWEDYAATVPKVDSCDNVIQQTGWNVFNTIYSQLSLAVPKPDYILTLPLRESGYEPPIDIDIDFPKPLSQIKIENKSSKDVQFLLSVGTSQTKSGSVFRGSYKYHSYIFLKRGQYRFFPFDRMSEITYYFKIINDPFPLGLAKPIYRKAAR